jgi:putative flippase GtrA
MNIPAAFTRWIKFNLVGALGMAVQLGALALLHHCAPTHYLLASAAAVELAVLLNFVGHIHYTWRDRRVRSPLRPLLRFHLSNGLVSLISNVLLMRVLVGQAHVPVLAANGLAILCCSLVNFSLSDTWAFVSAVPEQDKSGTTVPCL